MSAKGAFGRLASSSLEELTKTVGPVAAKSVFDYFQDEDNQRIVLNLKKAGVDLDGYLDKEGGEP
ncbi:MAG: hypothetical protein KAY32_15495 [Candidatus Eisenbacteria sp.]|nr:hypothetical protein [Candidatus Eisenbacteria bacterium]